MANYSAIKAAVNAYIKANGKKEITGRILNSVLNATIDSLGRFFQFAGAAIPTDDPGTPDQNVCYLATEPGLYTHFGNIRIANEEVALLFWNGEWVKESIALGIQEVAASVDNQVGTPSVDVSYSGGQLVLTFHNLKGEQGIQGEQGAAAGFGTIEADINEGVGTPGVSVETSGDNTAKNLMFHFTNLKGETGVTSVVATIDDTSGTPSCQVSLVNGVLTLAFSGLKGLKGDTGVSADYPVTIYNGLDSDATDQALAAAQGKVLDGKISQLRSEVEGKTILSYSGAQAIIPLPEAVSQETLAHIKMTGNVGDINSIAFLASDSSALLSIPSLDFEDCVVPIPANTAKIGIYQKTGKTLDINATITEIGLEQALELSEREKGLVIDSLGWTAQVCSFYNAVKCVRYYAPNNLDVPYIRLFGFYTNKIQLSVSYNKSTNIDFTTPASERPTGVKTHILTNGDKQIVITVNWDVLSATVGDGLYSLGIRINDYSGAIVPTIKEKIEKAVQELDLSRIEETSEQVGEGIGASNFNNSWLYCPNKSFTKDGYLSEIGFKAGADCTLTVYVGELDQRYLFIPRSSHSFACVSGDNVLDVKLQKIAVYAGEFVAFRASTGGVKFNNRTAGDPLSENSFLYTANNGSNLFQLQVYGAQKIFKINFYAKTTTDVFIRQTLESLKLQAQISTMGESVGSISSSIGIVNDAQGNKYRLKVVNGAVVPVPLNFRNVLCVGNSFTVHPTTTDTGAAFVTSYWWGHWAMAASSPNVAWTKLLQNSLRVNQNDAVVTPIFGRPYETGAYSLTDNDAFVYWDNGTRKSLKANLASFSGVDCIVFFLGDNYSGNDWETKFGAMCEQFATWFPSASIYCVGAVVSASVSSAIQNVASAKGYPFIDVLSIKTQPLRNREGNFVLGDDNALHQINYSAVGNHFGDYGQFKLNEKIATALGVNPVAVAYAVTLESQLLSLLQFNYLEDSIVSIFADESVNSISVVDASNNAITATSHSTDYGKIFTFTMPASDVSVSVAS